MKILFLIPLPQQSIEAAIHDHENTFKDPLDLTGEELVKLRPIALLQLTEIMEKNIGRMPILRTQHSSSKNRLTFRSAMAQATTSIVNTVRRDSNQSPSFVFGISLEACLEREKTKIVRDKTDNRVAPIFIVRVLEYLEDMAMHCEGLFRKAGSAGRIRLLRDHCEASKGDVDLYEVEAHPNDVAAILKQFLRELPDPLLTEKFSDTFIASQGS